MKLKKGCNKDNKLTNHRNVFAKSVLLYYTQT